VYEKNRDFRPIYLVYLVFLENDTRYSHSYYGMQIGKCTHAFERYNIERSHPGFKATPFFDVEYSRNVHCYNGDLHMSYSNVPQKQP